MVWFVEVPGNVQSEGRSSTFEYWKRKKPRSPPFVARPSPLHPINEKIDPTQYWRHFSRTMDERCVKALLDFARNEPEEFKRTLDAGFLKLDKMAAARRQLNTAIWLWFQEADPASIHTLTAAAFRVLAALCFHRNKRQPTPLNAADLPEELRPYSKMLRDQLAASETFLKHARTDPEHTHAITISWTEHYIFHAIKAYTELKGTCDQHLMSLFVLRFGALHPQIFDGKPSLGPLLQESWDIETIKNRSRIEFFERFGGPDRLLPPERF